MEFEDYYNDKDIEYDTQEIKNLIKYKFENDVTMLQIFSNTYNVDLQGISVTNETGNLEPIYFFTDDLGGYTINGIKNSLEEKLFKP